MSKESRALTDILKLISTGTPFTFCVGNIHAKIANKLTRQGFLKRQYIFKNYIEYYPTKRATPLLGLETNNSRLKVYKSIKYEPVFPTIEVPKEPQTINLDYPPPEPEFRVLASYSTRRDKSEEVKNTDLAIFKIWADQLLKDLSVYDKNHI